MGLWPNSTPFFGAVAFCTTKIDVDFDLFDDIVDPFIKEEAIEVDQLEETNKGGHWGGPRQRDK